MHPTSHNIHSIGWVESVFKEKFGAPRQSGVVPSATGTLHFHTPYDNPDCFDELEGFSHLWLITNFHLTPENETFRPKVRPPKLGGEKKVGIFATRSPFRPNKLALSVVKIEAIINTKQSISIKVSGLDLVDGTPLIDVKPYLPYSDALPEAQTNFGLPPSNSIEVVSTPPTLLHDLTLAERALIQETLQAKPAPAHAHASQSFGVTLGQLNISWFHQGEKIIITEIERKC